MVELDNYEVRTIEGLCLAQPKGATEVTFGIVYGKGRNKWVDVDKLSPEGIRLLDVEPGSTVTINKQQMLVETVCVDPPCLVVKPNKGARH